MGFRRKRKTKSIKVVASIDVVGPADLTLWLTPLEWIAHWGFASDTAESWVTGQLLLCDDGVLLRRYGGSSYNGETTYKYREWDKVSWWPGTTDPDEAIRLLRGFGYDLYEPGPVPPGESSAGPFPGSPGTAEPI